MQIGTTALPENRGIDAFDLAGEFICLFLLDISSSSVKSDLYIAIFAFDFASLNDAVKIKHIIKLLVVNIL